MINQKNIEVIKNSVPILQDHGVEITTLLYKKLFEKNPEFKNLFDMERQHSGHQPVALAMIIVSAAEYIDNLEEIKSSVKAIGLRHVATHVKPEYYAVLGECLIESYKEVLGNLATDEFLEAWTKAYRDISNMFIEIEKGIRKENHN
ncbi:MAG: globin domain-containing protein [Sarcina sp.]